MRSNDKSLRVVFILLRPLDFYQAKARFFSYLNSAVEQVHMLQPEVCGREGVGKKISG